MKKGFTLIELLVVTTIIAVLIGIASVSYAKATQSARDAKRKTDLEQIRQALETYRSENGYYPSDKSLLESNYITTLPKDPKDPARVYTYTPATAPALTYSLCATLEATGSNCVYQP